MSANRKLVEIRKVSPRTIAGKRVTGEDIRIGRLLYPEHVDRPRTRGECKDGPRPCPFVGCRYHLWSDLEPSGNLKVHRPELEPWDLERSCALDIADAGPITLEEVGGLLNRTRERVRQIEERTIERLNEEGIGEVEFPDPQASSDTRYRTGR